MLATTQFRICSLKPYISEHIKLQFYMLICMGVESSFLILRTGLRLAVFENWVPKRSFGTKREEESEIGKNCTMAGSIICTHPCSIIKTRTKLAG